jgi:hypothetical protein
MIASTEDRHAPRTRSQLPVRYEVIPFDGRGFVDAQIEDLSPDGLRFQCRDEVRARSGMLLELQIPDAQPVRFVGRAAWVRELPDHSGFEVGGSFEDQTTRGRNAIERFLQHEALSPGL